MATGNKNGLEPSIVMGEDCACGPGFRPALASPLNDVPKTQGNRPMPLPAPRSLAAAICAFLLPIAAADADTKAVYQSANGTESLTFQVKGPMVRWDARELSRDQRYALFDSARGVMILVDDGRKEITEMKPEALRRQREQMQAQMAPMLKQLQEQLKNMPPEQRQMIEKQMGTMMKPPGDAPAMAFTTRKIGSGTVKGIPCQRLSVLRDGKQEHEVCLATRAAAGVPTADYETMKKMFDTMRDMASAVATVSMPMAADLDGVPLEMKSDTQGTVRTLKSISTDTLPADAFKLPPYKKVTFDRIPGMR